VTTRKERKDWVINYGTVFLFLSLCHTSSPSLPFPFSLPHCITQSSFFFLVATLHHSVFLLLSFCHTSSRKGRLGDEVWQRERKKKDWVRKCGKEKGKRRLSDGV
jgi:hypothetical protein